MIVGKRQEPASRRRLEGGIQTHRAHPAGYTKAATASLGIDIPPYQCDIPFGVISIPRWDLDTQSHQHLGRDGILPFCTTSNNNPRGSRGQLTAVPIPRRCFFPAAAFFPVPAAEAGRLMLLHVSRQVLNNHDPQSGCWPPSFSDIFAVVCFHRFNHHI